MGLGAANFWFPLATKHLTITFLTLLLSLSISAKADYHSACAFVHKLPTFCFWSAPNIAVGLPVMWHTSRLNAYWHIVFVLL